MYSEPSDRQIPPLRISDLQRWWGRGFSNVRQCARYRNDPCRACHKQKSKAVGINSPNSETHRELQLLSGILQQMSPRTSRIIAAVVLLICFACPIVEFFDHWDHTAQTGNDTEYAFVVVGLCVGVAYAFARFVLTLPRLNAASEIILHFSDHQLLSLSGRGSFFTVPILLSPPVLALRI